MSGMLPLRENDPREVGGYRLLGRLGEGGQGVVFLALSSTGTRAAVKLLPPTSRGSFSRRGSIPDIAGSADATSPFCPGFS